MTDREKLEQAIAALEAQRATLGDVAVDAAIAGLREKLRDSAQLSGGEQMAAALAVRLALLKEVSEIDVAFFDEPTANLDAHRRGKSWRSRASRNSSASATTTPSRRTRTTSCAWSRRSGPAG